MNKITNVWSNHKGKIKFAVVFVFGGLAATGYIVPEAIKTFVLALVQ